MPSGALRSRASGYGRTTAFDLALDLTKRGSCLTRRRVRISARGRPSWPLIFESFETLANDLQSASFLEAGVCSISTISSSYLLLLITCAFHANSKRVAPASPADVALTLNKSTRRVSCAKTLKFL